MFTNSLVDLSEHGQMRNGSHLRCANGTCNANELYMSWLQLAFCLIVFEAVNVANGYLDRSNDCSFIFERHSREALLGRAILYHFPLGHECLLVADIR